MIRWPNQIRALTLTTEAIVGGGKRICVTSPTGTGKTFMFIDMIEWAVQAGMRVALFTNRRMLLEQTIGVLSAHGIEFGVQAAGHELAFLRQVQIAMTQTVLSRGHRGDLYDLILVDELHNQKGDGLQKILAEHLEGGKAAMVGYTATPLDIGDVADELIVAGNVSEGRACGALVPAHTYGPDEPDLSVIKRYRVGEDMSEADNSKAIMRPGVFARVFENWQRLNSDWKPTILFAPDVAGSIYFAEQFASKGVRSAHIDGDKIWLDGELYESNQEKRDELARLHKDGHVPIVCNRFVLREGIDWPWVSHGILATTFGSLTSYLQACGRMLRASSGKQSCVIQDHGGGWWRHGSINADREWSLGQTAISVGQERIDKLREKKEPEPIHCPKCAAIRLSGPICPQCNYASNARSRVVIQTDGSLREMRGDIIKPRKVSQTPQTERDWEGSYWQAYHSKKGMTFSQARGFFFHKHGYWPPENLPLMPKSSGDWHRKVKDVPRSELNPKPQIRDAG